MPSVKQTLMSAAVAVAATAAMSNLEAKQLEDKSVKMFFSNPSDRNRHFNKLRKSKSKNKAAKKARKKNRRK